MMDREPYEAEKARLKALFHEAKAPGVPVADYLEARDNYKKFMNLHNPSPSRADRRLAKLARRGMKGVWEK